MYLFRMEQNTNIQGASYLTKGESSVKKTAIAIGLMLASGLAMAQQAQPKFYVGASIGEARVNAGDLGDYINESASELRALGVQNVSSKVDESDTAFKIFAGYQFNKWFALEGGYANFGEFDVGLSASDSRGPISASANASAKVSAWFIDAVGHLPANDSFSVFGKAGLAYTRTETKGSESLTAPGQSFSGNFSEKENEVVPKVGVGVQWNATANLSFRAEYEVYFNVGEEETTGESNVKMLTAGAMFRF
jgi:OOP family OmpA-OmpF porin